MNPDSFVPDLARPVTSAQLAKALGIGDAIFEWITTCGNPEILYQRHLIPKRVQKRGGEVALGDPLLLQLNGQRNTAYRVVWEPKEKLIKFAHKSAARVLAKYLTRPSAGIPHPASFGSTTGRSTRRNAQLHVGARRLVSADIKDFFPTISRGRVESALRTAGIREEVAGALARFLCINESLPMGLNSSPLIASLVAYPLDVELSDMASQLECTYSRYVDDLTFSGKNQLPSRAEIEVALSRHGFEMNTAKFRTSKRGQKHYVTGLSVGDPQAPHAPRKMKKRLRQELHFIGKFGLKNHLASLGREEFSQEEVNRIDGTVSYIASLEPKLAYSLRNQWTEICAAERVERSFKPRKSEGTRQADWYVDESEIKIAEGASLLAVCVAEILEPAELSIRLAGLFSEEAGDAFGTSSAVKMIQKGLHWNEASWSQRERVVNLLAVSPVRAMIAISPVIGPAEFKDTYLQLLARLLDVAFRQADDAIVSITVEANRSKVSEPAVRRAIKNCYENLETANRRRPLEPLIVRVVGKGGSPEMCVPDVLLGCFGHYAKPQEDPSRIPLGVNLFERLRNRFSVIFDEYAGTTHTSRRPFYGWSGRTGIK